MLSALIAPILCVNAFFTGDGDNAAAALPRAPQPADWRALGVGRLAPALQAITLDGTQWNLASAGDAKAIVLAMTSATCPVSRKYAPVLARFEQQYGSGQRSVRFVYINANSAETLDQMREHVKQQGLTGAYLPDHDGHVADALHAHSTAEVFLLDAARTIVYRGAIDDQYGLSYALDAPRANYLADALDATLAGKPVPIAATTAPGCVIDAADAKQAPPAAAANPITWRNRISRIVQSNCVECHRAGGIAPFSLETLQDVTGRAKMIASVVNENIMPPWFAAPTADGATSPWANDRSLAADDKADLLAWLKSSERAEGDAKDAPLPRTFPAEWKIGQPDVILQLPEPQAVKAEGIMPYVHVRVDTDFDEDRWVQAIEVQPTARNVVHHVLVFALPPLEPGQRERDRIREVINEGQGFFAAYVPGGAGVIYPDGFAKPLPKHSTLIFQLHYTPNGTATSDQTRIAMRFATKPPEHVIRVVGIANHRISIPPGDANHDEHASLPVLFDAHVLAFMPHMHVRGKAFRYEATLPDGTTQPLLDVPHYDFNWQLRYEARQPIALPKGAKINVTAWYDNSSGNPANPDPAATVRWGPQTFNEMMLGYLEYYRDDEAREK